jgi:hypothetical protein
MDPPQSVAFGSDRDSPGCWDRPALAARGRSAEWSITDGSEVKVSAQGIEVMKQQNDGTWKIVIDHAFGAAANLTA